MTIQQMIDELRDAGYTVSKRRSTAGSTASRKPVLLNGKRHEACVDHHKVDGYTSKVCVLDGQDADTVIAFAAELALLAPMAGEVLTAARMRDAAPAALEEAA